MMLEALVYQGKKKHRTESYNDNEDEYCVDHGVDRGVVGQQSLRTEGPT